MLEDLDLNSLMFFLTIFGRELPRILRDLELTIEKIERHPRGKLWLEKAVSLGVAKLEEGIILINWNRLRELRRSIREALEECLR